MLKLSDSSLPNSSLDFQFQLEDTIPGLQAQTFEPGINNNGKRPLQDDIPSPPPETVFFSKQDLPAVRRLFDACRSHMMPIANRSQFHSDSALLHEGMRPYDSVRNQSYGRLTEMCFISDRSQANILDPNNDLFLVNLKKEVIKSILGKNGNLEAFNFALQVFTDQFQTSNLFDGSRYAYLNLFKGAFVADTQHLYQGGARDIFTKIIVDQVIASNPFLSAIKKEADLWLDTKRIDKEAFYHQIYSDVAAMEAQMPFDPSEPSNIFRFYRQVFTKLQVEPDIHLDAKFVEMCSNILVSDITLPEGKRDYLAQIQDVFIEDPQNLYEGKARYRFVEMAVDETLVTNKFLNALKEQVDLWLEANEVSDNEFYHHLYSHIAEESELADEDDLAPSVDLFDPDTIFKFYRDVFTKMVIEVEETEDGFEENPKIDLEKEFFGFCSDTLAINYLPEGIGQDSLKAMLDQCYERLMSGSNHLKDKYEPLIKEFFEDLDMIIADVENTTQLIEENNESKDLFSLQVLELLDIRDKFTALLTTFNDDLTQFHVQRVRQNQIHTAMRDFSNAGMAHFPYLCTTETLDLSREEPGASTIISLLKRYYSVYDGIHDANMLYLRKTISTVRQAKLNLEKIIKKYDLLLHGPKNEGSQKRLCTEIKV